MRSQSFHATAEPNATQPGISSHNGTKAGETPDWTDGERPNAIVENARREFTSAFGDLARGKRNWQLIAFALVAIVVIQAFATFRLASAAHPVPYLIQVDRLGSITTIGNAEQMRDPDARLVASQVADFIRSVRTVLPAVAGTAEADLLRRGYSFAAPAAAAFLNAYFADPAHDPRLLGARLTRDVRVTSAIRVPDPADARRAGSAQRAQTWRLQWLEADRAAGPVDADSSAVAAWEGYITLQIVPPKTTESIQANPLGLRITSIAWTRLAGQAVVADSLNVLTGSSHDGGVR